MFPLEVGHRVTIKAGTEEPQSYTVIYYEEFRTMTDAMPQHAPRGYRYSDDHWQPEGEGWHTYQGKRPPNGAMIEITRRVNASSKIINADDLHLPHDPQYLFWRLA